MITDFFVASKEEFEMSFEDWLPVAKEKIEKINPLTNEIYLDWGPDPVALSLMNVKKEQSIARQNEENKSRKQGFFAKLFGSKKVEQPIFQIPDISQFHHVQYRRVDLFKLASLFSILSSLTFEDALDNLEKPAYVLPDYNEQAIHILPEDFLKLLANIEKESLSAVANQWWQTEELQLDGFSEEDTQDVLLTISRLAIIAISEQKYLFHWWCL